MNFHAFVAENPLLRFSLYTHLQSRAILDLGESIKFQLDSILRKQGKADVSQGDAFGDIWLWTIGAYEVVRTMADPKWKESWSESKYEEIVTCKRRIADIRVPFAKQELRSGEAITAENSIYGLDHDKRTYFFQIGDNVFDIREEIDLFEELISGISPEDVLGDISENER